MDWILSNKEGEEETTDDFQELIHQQYTKMSKHALTGLSGIAALSRSNTLREQGKYTDALI